MVVVVAAALLTIRLNVAVRFVDDDDDDWADVLVDDAEQRLRQRLNNYLSLERLLPMWAERRLQRRKHIIAVVVVAVAAVAAAAVVVVVGVVVIVVAIAIVAAVVVIE